VNESALSIGDGAMGFWATLEGLYPEARQQRCGIHKKIDVLICLLKSAQPKGKDPRHDIWQAETKADVSKMHSIYSSKCMNKIPKGYQLPPEKP